MLWHNGFIALAVAASAAILAACDQTTSAGEFTSLAGTSWKVEGIPNNVDATIAFGTDGRVTGFAGCNRYFATYTQSGQSLTVNGIGSTRKICPAVEMSVEREFLKTLAIVERWNGDGTRIELTAPADKTTVRLARDKS